MTDDIARIAADLPKGSARACMKMTEEWQFCGKATFDANGAWNLSRKSMANPICERRDAKDGRWSRYQYRLTPFGILVRNHLEGA